MALSIDSGCVRLRPAEVHGVESFTEDGQSCTTVHQSCPGTYQASFICQYLYISVLVADTAVFCTTLALRVRLISYQRFVLGSVMAGKC